MLIASATQKMIEFYQGSCHDINHFLKVWAFAKTIGELEGMDYQILLEADFLVNADESGYTKSAIRSFRERVFRTAAGIRLLNSIYQLNGQAL